MVVPTLAGGGADDRPTRAGRRAQAMWEPLAGIIEDRWRAPFGGPEITAMRDALQAPATQIGAGLPRYPMVLQRGGWPDGS
jgi:hypothetical protein